MKVSVFGLGYTGCVTAACFAQVGHQVTGVDISFRKVTMINQGQSPIVEKELERIISDQVVKGNLRATQNAGEAIAESEVIVICVGTPDNGRGGVDYKQVERVCMDIGTAMRDKNEFVTVVLRSTILPGYVRELTVPTLEACSGKKAGEHFGFAVNPEFLREGSGVYDFYHPAKTVAAITDEHSKMMLEKLYEPLTDTIFYTGIDEASFIKYVDNSFHAVKVTFANEIGRLCKSLGLDTDKVIELFLNDNKLNLSSAYLTPGFAFGGSCLPKDLRTITHKGESNGVSLPLLHSTIESNLRHIDFAFDSIAQAGKTCVGFRGISFKSDTDDVRESPYVILIKKLIDAHFKVLVYDENVNKANLMGTNKEYLSNMLPLFKSILVKSETELLEQCQVLVLGSTDTEGLEKRISKEIKIVDLTGIAKDRFKTQNGWDYEDLCR